jgi:hypothetical protein
MRKVVHMLLLLCSRYYGVGLFLAAPRPACSFVVRVVLVACPCSNNNKNLLHVAGNRLQIASLLCKNIQASQCSE